MWVCVFCGSSAGRDPQYVQAAQSLGKQLAGRGLGLVYGGASVGLMGELADAARATGGEVTGVIPQHLVEAEIAHTGLGDLRVVGSMHERKATMSELADAFVMMPGGVGTLEEFFEMWTWSQIGLHRKPIGLLDVAGFFAPLRTMIDHMVGEGFVRRDSADVLRTASDPGDLLDALVGAARS